MPQKSTSPSSKTLVLENISKSYRSRMVIDHINLSVSSGEIVGIFGPNGAGKTTTFYIALGLLQSDSGNIYYHEKNITHIPFYKRARLGIGYLPQDTSVFVGLNVEDNILAALEIFEKNKNDRQDQLNHLLTQLNLTHRRKTLSIKLSGGEKKRLEIARTLALKPNMIFFDEPLAGIDPLAVSDIKKIFVNLKNQGISIVITDHNVKDIFPIVDHVYILYDSKILAEGTPKEITLNPLVKKIYLGDDFNI